MMRSLYSGVAGLKTHQTKMDVIGNNIANVNTTSFKSQSITFSDLMYQTTQTASGATETKGGVNARQIGLGAKSGAIATAIETQGATQTTNNPFDIMITGKSFFIVNNGQENLYTRDGSFYVDGAGNLAMQSNGYFVMGWAAQEDPETGAITVNKNGGLTNLQIMSADNSTYSPASTTASLFSGNIDDYDTNIVSVEGKSITLEFYDNKGYLYTGKFSLKDTDYKEIDPQTGEERPVFSLQLTDIIDSTGNSLGEDVLKKITFGKTQTVNQKINDRFYIERNDENPKIASIWQEANAPAYQDATIKTSGTDLSALLKIEGFLDDVYKLPNNQTYKTKYSDINKYTITKDNLVIEFNSEDASIKALSDDTAVYTSVATTNDNPYYYDKTTHLGYALPSSSENGAYPLTGPLSKLDPGLVNNVFGAGINEADFGMYSYIYNETTQVLTITASAGPRDTAAATPTTGLGTTYDDFFTGSRGAKISEIIAQAAAGTITSPAGTPYTSTSYTYDSTAGKMVISGKYVEAGADDKQIAVTNADTELFALLKNYSFDLDTSALSAAQINDLKNVVAYPKLNDNFTASLSADGNTVTVTSGDFSADITSGNLFDELKARLEADPTDNNFAGNTLTNSAELQTLVDDTFANFTFSYKLNSTTSPISYDITYSGNGFTNETRNADQVGESDLVNFLLEQEESIPSSSLTPAQEAELLAKLGVSDTDITAASFTFKGRALTGTPGYTVNVHYEGNIEKEAEIDTFNHVSSSKTADLSTYDYGVPSSVYRNKNTNTSGYVLLDGTDGKYTLDQIKDQLGVDVFRSIYGNDFTFESLKGEYPSIDDEKFTVTLSGSRMIVSHVQTDENKINDDYEATVNAETGTVTYKTVNPKVVAKDIPVSGNVEDLLSSASGDYKNVLSRIFDVSDDMARAFGKDGTYEFSDDFKEIKLSTGSHTVQLVFDPANGSLVSANDNSAGKGLVNLMFDQSTPGLEAFGYQLQAGDDPSLAGHMTIDFSTVTNYNTSGSATIKAVKGDKSSLNTGRAVGEMNGISISTDGQIYATYSNGQTKLLGQIATAEFANASGLSKEGDNLYKSTLNSGDPTVQDITTDGGYMNTGVLEMSNVDLSSQFTEMITTQRGFQANSRIITVSDTLLEELTNLKR